MGADRELSIILKLRDQLSGELRTVGTNLQAFSDRLKNVGARFTEVGQQLSMKVTAPIVGLGVLSLKTAGDFEYAMNRVRAVSGATGKDFANLEKQAKQLGRTTQFTASQAADAMGFLAMAGFEANEILEAMPGTLQLAASAQLDLASAADIVSNVLTGYAKDTSELAHVNDVLVKAFTSANTNLVQLGEAMKYAGPVASSAGVQFEEAAAAISLMGNAGIQASMAGTSMRGAISRLLSPTTQVTDAMREVGLVATDAEGNLLPLVDIVRQLEENSATTGQMMELFGLRAGPAMSALVSQSSAALADMTDKLQNSGGIAQEIAETQMEGFRGAMLRLRSAWEGFLISLADTGFLDAVADLVEKLAVGLQHLAEWWEKLSPKTQKYIAILAGVAAVLGPLLLMVGIFITLLGTLAGPIGIIALAIFGLIAAVSALYIWWEDLVAFFKKHWDVILTMFLGNLGSLLAFFVNNWGKIKEVTIAVWTSIKDFIADIFEGIGKIIQTVIDKVTFLVDAFRDAIDLAKEIGGGAVDFVSDLLPGRASGGTVTRGRAYTVGENGPELFVPNTSGTIVPNHRMSGGANIVVNITGTFLSEDAAEQMGDMLIDRLRMSSKFA